MSNNAFVVNKYGNLSETLSAQTLEKPVATGRDVLVRNVAVATNPIDVKKLTNFGQASDADNLGLVGGFDSAGVVEAVGPDVTSFKVGDEVYFAGSFPRAGAFQDFTLVDERIVGKKPKSVSFAEAATVPLCILTAWEGLTESLNIPVPATEEEKKENKSKSILVVNGAGGVGSYATQVASRVLGLTVISTASRPETIEWTKKNGADHVINHHKDYKPQFDELGLGKVDYVFVCVDLADAHAQSASVLKPLGSVVSITLGDLSKADWSAYFYLRATISFGFMFCRALYDAEPEKQSAILNTVSGLIDSGVLQHAKNAEFEFTLDGLKKALEQQASGKSIGKIAVVRKE